MDPGRHQRVQHSNPGRRIARKAQLAVCREGRVHIREHVKKGTAGEVLHDEEGRRVDLPRAVKEDNVLVPE